MPSAARRWLLVLGAGLVMLGGGAAAYWAAGTPGWWSVPKNAAVASTAEKIRAGENRLQEIAGELARLGHRGQPATVRALLTEAVACQTELMRTRPVPSADDERRLGEWQAQLADQDVSEWVRLSETAETAAIALALRDAAASAEKFKEAWHWQQKINRSVASSALKDQAREMRLERTVVRTAAEPKLAIAAQALAQAEAAVGASSWTEAREGFAQAQELYRKVEAEFPQAGLVPLTAGQTVANGLRVVHAGEAKAHVDELVQLAERAAAGHQLELADRHYAAAAKAQQQLNAEFADSRWVSMERLASIENARQNLGARELTETLRVLDERAARHRHRRENFQSQELMAVAAAKLTAISTQYPQATRVDPEMRRRVAWLLSREAEIVVMQDRVYDLIRVLPGARGRAMLKTEVAQSLFSLVMKQNPSRQVGPSLPVDSVTHSEAEEFCQRLGWVMGVRVRLPTEEEFKAALGDPLVVGADAWGAENGSGQTQPTAAKSANAAGYYDLLGNVAEWLAPGEGDKAVAAGGSFAESRAQLQSLPLRSVLKTTRAATIGFRFVLEVDLTAEPAR